MLPATNGLFMLDAQTVPVAECSVFGPVTDSGSDLRFCGELAIHKGASFHLAKFELHADVGALKVQTVAGNYLTVKFDAVKAGKEKKLVVKVAHA